uniref:Uncharacterized protein n=2 Tax=Palpitomonas bilix TaxID=652834 RepID=A0A7S3D8G5_9EUKA|mmetsp:Transcript_26833/g.68982  ORF Transcript_26833/g.68982 Transcript_26833/m.68982 type:complete len:705 (+) Transcript_26833:262-2376(+)
MAQLRRSRDAAFGDDDGDLEPQYRRLRYANQLQHAVDPSEYIPKTVEERLLDLFSPIPQEVDDDEFEAQWEATDYLKPSLQLLPHQKLGVHFLSSFTQKPGLQYDLQVKMLADEMGLGKTIQALAALCQYLTKKKNAGREDDTPVLIVVPLALVENWQREIRRFTTLSVGVITTAKCDLNAMSKDVVLTTYSKLVVVHTHKMKQTQCQGRILFDVSDFAVFLPDMHHAAYAHTSTSSETHHRVKNEQSSAHVAVKSLKIPNVWLLSGTPVPNMVSEVGAQCRVGCPHKGTKGEFLSEKKLWSALSRNTHLQEMLSERVILRRDRSILEDSLPPVYIESMSVPLSDWEWKTYSSISTASMDMLEEYLEEQEDEDASPSISVTSILASITRMRQTAGSPLVLLSRKTTMGFLQYPPLYKSPIVPQECEMAKIVSCHISTSDIDEGDSDDGERGRQVRSRRKQVARHMCAAKKHYLCDKCKRKEHNCPICKYVEKFSTTADLSECATKAKRAADIAIEAFKRGEKCVIFSQFISTADVIQACIERMCPYRFKQQARPVLRLDGGHEPEERDSVVGEFISCKYPCAFLTSPAVGGEGLTILPSSQDDPPINTVVLFEPWWNDAKDRQALARCWRFGQTNAVRVFRLFSRNSIDEAIESIQVRKREETGYIVPDVDHEGFHRVVASGVMKEMLVEVRSRMEAEEQERAL